MDKRAVVLMVAALAAAQALGHDKVFLPESHAPAGLMADHGTAVVFITGESGVADWPEVAALKPAAVLEKPFLHDDLIAALQGAAEARIPG